MKISIIVPSFYPAVIYGGPIFSTLNTCKELSKLNDVEIRVSTTNTNMTSKLNVKVNTWNIFQKNFYVKYYDETIIDKFSFRLFINIWKDIRNADVVHIQSIFNTPTPISLIYAKLFFKKPVLISSRGSLGEWCIGNGNKFKKLWLKFFIKPFANHIIWHATAEEEKQEILSLFPKAKVSIIPNGINLQSFQSYNSIKRNDFILKFTGEKKEVAKIIISMGRLQKKKGFDILIESFSRVLKKIPNAFLLIAGPNEGEENNLLDLIQKLNLSHQVFLIGAIENQDKIDFLANADLFVLPSYNENFGNVYLESLATGTPIIASKNTPWSNVEKYKCGRWVNNTVEETTQAMLNVLEYHNQRQLSINSKQLSQHYSWESIALQFSNLFQNLKKGEY